MKTKKQWFGITKAEQQPGTVVRYYKRRKRAFQKERGSTTSEPVTVKNVHKYEYKSGGTGRNGHNLRLMPYELELVKSDKSKTQK